MVNLFSRGLRLALRALLFVLLVALVAEGFLRAASLFAKDRAGAWPPGAEVRILSVGDSHTFGTNVAEEESYPAQLQRFLDEIEPGRFSVVDVDAETIRSEGNGLPEGSDPSERSYREFRSIAAWLRAAGLILVRYPLAAQWPFEPANRAMERVAGEFSLPIVDSRAAISRIPLEQREWMWMSHPSGPMYREIARDLVPLVVELADARH